VSGPLDDGRKSPSKGVQRHLCWVEPKQAANAVEDVRPGVVLASGVTAAPILHALARLIRRGNWDIPCQATSRPPTELTCRDLRRHAGVGCRNGPQVGDPLTGPDDDDPPSRVIDDV
jgi:hypothetical protein